MSAPTGGIARRVAAAVATVALGVLGAVAVAVPASAAGGNIDPDAKGSIIIHKHENQNGTSATQNPDGSGTAIPTPGIDGVTFQAYTIMKGAAPVNLTDPANWPILTTTGVAADGSVLTGAGATAGWTIAATAASSTTTASGGLGPMANLPVAAYVVKETAAPPTVVQRSPAFIVSIPFPFQNNWLYDVNVYPKNGLSSIEKTVTPQTGLGLGSVASFPVTTKIPALAPGTSFQDYVVTDTLDARLGSVGVASVTVGGTAVDSSYYSVASSGQTVTVTFTAAGLTWLKAQGDKSLVTTFQGTVNTLGNGVINNTATVYVNDPGKTNGITSNPVHTNWGDLLVKKTDSSSPALPLAGAIVEVYAAADPYAADCSTATPTGSAVNVNGVSTFTTTSNGTVRVAGLFVSDSTNAPIDASQRCYVVKEVQAPAGYVTPTGNAALHGVAVTIGASAAAGLTIVNEQTPAWMLPLTGGSGALWYTVGGIALVIVAVGAAVVVTRRMKAHA